VIKDTDLAQLITSHREKRLQVLVVEVPIRRKWVGKSSPRWKQ